jgi:hypothetical protein
MTKEAFSTVHALKLALEALEDLGMKHFESTGEVLYKETFTAIKEALAQPEQEPVAFVQGCNRGQWEIFPAKAYQIFENEQPLYTTPPQRKPLTGKMLLRAAQASLSPEQYDHFEAMSKHQPDIYDRLAYSIGVQDE